MICDMCNKDINNDKIINGKINIIYIDKDGMEKEKEKDSAIVWKKRKKKIQQYV